MHATWAGDRVLGDLKIELARVLAAGGRLPVASLPPASSGPMLSRLSDILAADPRLSTDVGLSIGGSARFLSPITLAGICYDRGLVHGPDEAVAWLHRIFSATEIEVVTIHLMSGVQCTAPIVLDSQFSFVPFEGFDLTQDEYAFAQPAVDKSRSSTLAYLLSSVRVGPPLAPVQTVGGLPFVSSPPGLELADERARRLLEMLPLVGPSSPRNEAAWKRVVDSDFQPLTSPSTHLVDGAAPFAPPAVIDASVGARFQRYEAMSTADRSRMAGLIEQLAGAAAASYAGDRAVSLCTLLEATFCSSTQRRGRQAAVKDALTTLLGTGTFNAAASSQVKTAFDVRNSMVHQGSATVTPAQQADISEVLKIAGAGLAKITDLGYF